MPQGQKTLCEAVRQGKYQRLFDIHANAPDKILPVEVRQATLLLQHAIKTLYSRFWTPYFGALPIDRIRGSL